MDSTQESKTAKESLTVVASSVNAAVAAGTIIRVLPLGYIQPVVALLAAAIAIYGRVRAKKVIKGL